MDKRQRVMCHHCGGYWFTERQVLSIPAGLRVIPHAAWPNLLVSYEYHCAHCNEEYLPYTDEDGHTWTSDPEEADG